MMIEVKPGVSLRGVKPEMFFAATVVATIFRTVFQDKLDCVITSGTEGKHGRGSLHYVGLALDFRTKHLKTQQKHDLETLVKRCLGAEYDVILEHEGERHEHLHVEFQPKRAMNT